MLLLEDPEGYVCPELVVIVRDQNKDATGCCHVRDVKTRAVLAFTQVKADEVLASQVEQQSRVPIYRMITMT